MDLNVVYHSSDLFSEVVAVSIASLLENNKDFNEINIFLIENKIKDSNKKKIGMIVSQYNRKITFINLPDLQKDFNLNFNVMKKKWNVFDSFCRLYLGTILPQYITKVLYLDADTLVVHSLNDLWKQDIFDYPLAAVRDCLSAPYYNLFRMTNTSSYCNSGMLLINLEFWRKNNIEQKMTKFIKEKDGFIFFMEQSVINIVLQNNIKILPLNYNVSTLIKCLSFKNIIRLRNPKIFYTEREIEEAKENPYIIHLTGLFYIKRRPWFKNSDHPYSSVFDYYRNLTPYKDNPHFDNIFTFKSILTHFIFKIIPTSITVYLISFFYNSLRPIQAKNDQKRHNLTLKKSFD